MIITSCQLYGSLGFAGLTDARRMTESCDLGEDTSLRSYELFSSVGDLPVDDVCSTDIFTGRLGWTEDGGREGVVHQRDDGNDPSPSYLITNQVDLAVRHRCLRRHATPVRRIRGKHDEAGRMHVNCGTKLPGNEPQLYIERGYEYINWKRPTFTPCENATILCCPVNPRSFASQNACQGTKAPIWKVSKLEGGLAPILSDSGGQAENTS
jgi:hypothetical protein